MVGQNVWNKKAKGLCEMRVGRSWVGFRDFGSHVCPGRV